MSSGEDNNAFEGINSSKKRKRESGRLDLHSNSRLNLYSFTNAGYSCTPKKDIANITQESNDFNIAKKDKSAADLVHLSAVIETNKFEVIRKPPKKKKKNNLEKACFVNTGLNLDVPEKQFNPFEVKLPSTYCEKSRDAQCFTNAGLNIQTEDTSLVLNPFEIQRNKMCCQIQNVDMESPTPYVAKKLLQIKIPFRPTIACRIDFKDLTPSKILAEELVFSPINNRILPQINEDDTIIDIGKELDLYQLELENSINEAKQEKTNCLFASEKLENNEEYLRKTIESLEPKTPEITNVNMKKSVAYSTHNVFRNKSAKAPLFEKNSNKDNVSNAIAAFGSFVDNVGVEYENTEDDKDRIDFQAPASFVRVYHKSDSITPSTLITEKGSSKSLKDLLTAPSEPISIKSIFRNSIRKLIHHRNTSNDHKMDKGHFASSDHHSIAQVFIENTRQSLRRKSQYQIKKKSTSASETSIVNVSKNKLRSARPEINHLETKKNTFFEKYRKM